MTDADKFRDFTRAGLCDQCTNVQIIENRRGSRFYRCRLADVDPAFVRYPPLPVLFCSGFAPGRPSDPSEGP